MEEVKVLLVDDEVLMCQELRSLVTLVPGMRVIDVCHDGNRAVRLIEELRPDLVMLDIQMPGQSGLQVAADIYNKPNAPLIVFATAYDEYALKAFALNAVDYILKPFDETDVERVMQKARRIISERKIKTAPYTKKFAGEMGDRIQIIHSDRIQFVFAKDRQVFIQTVDGEVYNSRLTLQDFESRLDPTRFFRCHRNYIVNIDEVKQIANWFNRGYLLLLKGTKQTEIPVSRIYTRRLKE